MISNLGQGIETVNRGENLAAFFGQQGFSRAANSLAVVDNQYFESTQRAGCVS
jgi:hypothetical protein